MSDDTTRTIKRARELLSNPTHWTQGASARHANGNVIGPREVNAACWCLFGALGVAAYSVTPGGGNPTARTFNRAADQVERVIGSHLAQWNDAPERTHTEVLAALDAAISEIEERLL